VKPDTSKQTLRLLFWETTIRCNLDCAHCRRVAGDEAATADMSTEQAKKMVDQLVQVGDEQGFMPILVFSGGEPLCREDLFEVVEYAGAKGLIPALATNGTLIDEKIAERIKQSGIRRVSISLDGATSEAHNKLRQQEGSFESAIRGIEYLRSKDVPFQINVTITKYNCDQLEDIYELAKGLGSAALHLFMLVPVGCGQQFDQKEMLNAAEYEDMMLKIAELDSRGELHVKVTCGPHYERVIRESGLSQNRSKSDLNAKHPGHGGESKGCLAGLGVLFVGHNGDIFPCGYLPVNCGNVTAQTIGEIWRDNKDLARMRDVNELDGKCGVCGYRNVCGGCRARAYAETGNYMSEEPFCEYIPPKVKKL
jgi:AdoMet-dependent heme synthase